MVWFQLLGYCCHWFELEIFHYFYLTNGFINLFCLETCLLLQQNSNKMMMIEVPTPAKWFKSLLIVPKLFAICSISTYQWSRPKNIPACQLDWPCDFQFQMIGHYSSIDPSLANIRPTISVWIPFGACDKSGHWKWSSMDCWPAPSTKFSHQQIVHCLYCGKINF